jgi:hypothetical protein
MVNLNSEFVGNIANSPFRDCESNQRHYECGPRDSDTCHLFGYPRSYVEKHHFNDIRSPLLGTGSGAYDICYLRVVDPIDDWRASPTDNPHQQYLHIAAEQGLVGLSIFTIAIYLWIWLITATPLNLFSKIALGALVTCIISGFFNGHFSSFVEGRLVWIFVSAMLAYDLSSKVSGCEKKIRETFRVPRTVGFFRTLVSAAEVFLPILPFRKKM